jgi:hypothetical protein
MLLLLLLVLLLRDERRWSGTDPKAAAAGIAGDEGVRLALVLWGVGWSNKTKSCCGCVKSLSLCCAVGAGRLDVLEGSHGDWVESVVKTGKSWGGMVAVVSELARELRIASFGFSSTCEGRAEEKGWVGSLLLFFGDEILTVGYGEHWRKEADTRSSNLAHLDGCLAIVKYTLNYLRGEERRGKKKRWAWLSRENARFSIFLRQPTRRSNNAGREEQLVGHEPQASREWDPAPVLR